MRDAFRGYYRPTEEEFSQLWQEGLFVFDANVLLNLYRYRRSTQEKLIETISLIPANRSWLPYQAALEYQENRLSVIKQQKKAYDAVKQLLQRNGKKIASDLHEFTRHPVLEVDGWVDRIDKYFHRISGEIERHEKSHPDWLESDPIREKLTEMFEGQIGAPYDDKTLQEKYKLGSERYDLQRPPGFADEKKEDNKKYGDVVLWFQIIDKAREAQLPIIFVTDDRKDDWWRMAEGKIIGPRPELVHEIFGEAGVLFYMYPSDRFMHFAEDYLGASDVDAAITEVELVRHSDERTRKALTKSLMHAQAGLAPLIRFSAKQEEMAKKVLGSTSFLQKAARAIALQEKMKENLLWTESLSSNMPSHYDPQLVFEREDDEVESEGQNENGETEPDEP